MRFRSVAPALLGLLVIATVAHGGAAGDPDPSFGTGGFVVTHVGDVSEAYDMVRQPDGKIVTAGYVEEGVPRATEILLVRYDADGALDATFGTGGIVRTDAVPGQSSRAKAITLQPDGKLVVVGFAAVGDYWDAGGDVVVVRYLPDGSLDPDFGAGGIVVTDLFGFEDQGRKVLVQPDGALVVTGFTHTAATTASQDAFVARYDASGALDATFGTGGVTALDFAGRVEAAYALARQADGKLVVLASSRDPLDPYYGPSHALLTRVDANGVLDPTFGSGGSTELSVSLQTGLTEMVTLLDGKLFAAGSYSDDGRYGYSILARFDADGILDVGFGDGGVVETPPGSMYGLGLAPDGKVLGAGPGFLWGHWWAMGVIRVDSDGERDPSFGNEGRASLVPGPFVRNSAGFAVASEPDGSAVTVAGFATDGDYLPTVGEPRYIALARFLASASACTVDGDCGNCERCQEGACANGPRATCEHPSGKAAKIMYAGAPVKPRIQWKWSKKIAGDPGFDPTTQAVGFCMWWGDTPIYESTIPPGSGWKTLPSGGVAFRDKTRGNFGIEKIKVGPNLEVKARGPEITQNPNGFPDALLVPGDDSVPLYVQLHAGDTCYGTMSPQSWTEGEYPSHVRRGLGY